MRTIIEWDKDLLLWLNGHHTPWLDSVMFLISKMEFSIPLYALLIFLIFRAYRGNGWFILIGAAVAVTLSEQITHVMKYGFERLRPSHEPALEGLLHIVNGYRGGLYGFASGHAADTFAAATLIWLLFRKTTRWASLIFLWSATVTYTRIYLGVHYPGDVIVGAAVGFGCGVLGFRIASWLIVRRKKGKEKT